MTTIFKLHCQNYYVNSPIYKSQIKIVQNESAISIFNFQAQGACIFGIHQKLQVRLLHEPDVKTAVKCSLETKT